MPSGAISGIRLVTMPVLYSTCMAVMLRPSAPTWVTIALRLFLPIARRECCCCVARLILALATFRICWYKKRTAKRGHSTRSLRGAYSPGTRRATAASWWVRPIPGNCAPFALYVLACRSWCPGWVDMVNGRSLQFLVPFYMPAMIVIMRLPLHMRRGRCATGSTRRGERYESKNGAQATNWFSTAPRGRLMPAQSSYDRGWPIWLYHGEDSGGPATGGSSLQGDDAASSRRQCSPAYGGDCIRYVKRHRVAESWNSYSR